ncbi:MAG: oligosaccharide flippase family protein [Chloroflexota bacterium]|nr:oligosaccharide flippase family protein [Chloroflexota bacterium]
MQTSFTNHVPANEHEESSSPYWHAVEEVDNDFVEISTAHVPVGDVAEASTHPMRLGSLEEGQNNEPAPLPGPQAAGTGTPHYGLQRHSGHSRVQKTDTLSPPFRLPSHGPGGRHARLLPRYGQVKPAPHTASAPPQVLQPQRSLPPVPHSQYGGSAGEEELASEGLLRPSETPARLNATGSTRGPWKRHATPFRTVQLVPQSEKVLYDEVARLDTISMFAVRARPEVGLQQDIFINDWVEDITRQETTRLSVVEMPVVIKSAAEEKRSMVASTAGNAALAGAGDFISAVLRYITNVFMTHIVDQSVYGIFVEANTVVIVLGYAAKLGLDSVLLRFLSTYRTQGERGKAAALIRFATSVSLISGLICALLFFVLSSLLAHMVYHKAVYDIPFKESALLVPLIGTQLVVASGLQALKAIKWKVYVDRLIQPGLTLVLLGVFYLLGLRLEALILATICGYLASMITGQILLRKAASNLLNGASPEYERKTWLRFAFPMFFNSMIRNILNSTDVLFLGALAATSQVGLYGAADRVSYFVVMPLIALNVIFSPIIAEFHSRGEHAQLANMFKIVTKWSFSLSWPIFLGCLVFHDAILGIFGAKYIAAGWVLIILAFGNLVDSGVGSVNYLLVMTGRPRVILVNTVTTVVVNVALAILLVPRYGIIGAALAAALAVVILNVVGLIEVYWIMKIHPYRWDMLKPLVAGIIASLATAPLAALIHPGYGHLAILGALCLVMPLVIVYVALLALFRFSEEDVMVFETVRAKLGKRKTA